MEMETGIFPHTKSTRLVIAEKHHMKMLKANGGRLLSDTGDGALQENKSETSRTLT